MAEHNIRKTLCLLFVITGLTMTSPGVAGQTQDEGIIKGVVRTAAGQPVPYASAALKGTGYGGSTDENGSFRIQAPAGRYTLAVSAVGLERKETWVTVKAGETATVDFTLNERSEHLREVQVNGEKTNKYLQERTDYVARMPLDRMENPQVYSSIPAVLLKEQVITRFDDALKNAPGITQLWESTGRGGDGAGYFSIRGFAVQPTMANGLPSLTNGSPDPANIERIEVIKGPSGTLFGSSLISYGGLINVVTKKPYHRFGAEAAYTAGSYGLNRITADVNTPLSREKDIALRINTAWHTENSFQDAGFRKSLFIAPSLEYRVNDRLSFLMNTEFFQGERTNPTMIFLNRSETLSVSSPDELGYDHKLSYTSNDISIKNPMFSLQGQMNYQLSDQWVSQTVLSRSSAKSDGYYSYIWEIANEELYEQGTYARIISKQHFDLLSTDIQQNFIGDFKIGSLRNRLVAGADYFHRSTVNNGTGYAPVDLILISQPAGGLSRPKVDSALVGAAVNQSKTREEVYSAYVSDVLNLTPALSVMASLRLDYFNTKGDISSEEDDFDQVALSPKFGIMYQPVKDELALFANYMNGFTNVQPDQETINGESRSRTFEPEQANQWEAGTKLDLLEGKLAATLSYYDIRVSNIVRQEIVENADAGTPDIFFTQDGENYSRGFEAEVVASPLQGLNLIAGYSYNESKVVKADSEEYLGRRPEGAGPQHMANAWISYQLNKGPLTGLKIGFGGNYASENKILNRSSTGVFALPSYTVLNASASYSVESWELTLKLDNLADKEYYNGWNTLNPQMPRRLLASVAFRF